MDQAGRIRKKGVFARCVAEGVCDAGPDTTVSKKEKKARRMIGRI